MKPHTEIFSDLIKENAGLRSENERLTAENLRLFEQAAALQAENGALRGQMDAVKSAGVKEFAAIMENNDELRAAIRAIIDRYDTAAFLSCDDWKLIENARKAL